MFDARTGDQRNYTANDLCALVTEMDTPAEIRQDAYIDFEVTRWGFGQAPIAWYPGCGTSKPFERPARPQGSGIRP